MIAQQCYRDQTDNQRTPVPHFRPGDMVWFHSKKTRSARPSRKLDHKREGPFEIMEDQNLNTPHPYRVSFPIDIKVPSVQHICELEPAPNDPYPGQIVPPPPPVEIDSEEEWEVEEMLDAKIRYWKLQYRIK